MEKPREVEFREDGSIKDETGIFRKTINGADINAVSWIPRSDDEIGVWVGYDGQAQVECFVRFETNVPESDGFTSTGRDDIRKSLRPYFPPLAALQIKGSECNATFTNARWLAYSKTPKIETKAADVAAEWPKVNKSQCRAIYDFREKIISATQQALYKSVSEEFDKCIEAKVLKYVRSHFPAVAAYADHQLYFTDGSSPDKKLFQLFNIAVLARNPESGFKFDDKDIYLKATGVGTLSLVFAHSGLSAQLDFRDYTGKLNIIGLVPHVRLDWAQTEAPSFVNLLSALPEGNHWDWDFIDKL
ncbi:MAG TPA: hypothetical protein PKX74_10580 [Leptospiraceae bacterium]|nr:hypothetical protein [Leptospirales bacterium]HMY45916.1 hypothetical protein [Leptospiraceae bacterium]HNN75322.1 hypothetical protein [Leptospiraceae bacterium]